MCISLKARQTGRVTDRQTYGQLLFKYKIYVSRSTTRQTDRETVIMLQKSSISVFLALQLTSLTDCLLTLLPRNPSGADHAMVCWWAGTNDPFPGRRSLSWSSRRVAEGRSLPLV